MARVGVRTCDRCGRWDSREQAVKRVSVAGLRRDLCFACRVALLIDSGVAAVRAIEFAIKQDGLPPEVDPDQLALSGIGSAADVGEEAPNEPIPLVPAGTP